MVSDPTGKKWVQAILGEYSNTLKSLSRRATNTDASDRLRYKNDIQNEAQIFIQNVKKGAFSFSIPSDEKTRVESDILSFQKSLISSVRASIEKQLDTDVKLFSTMNMSVENKEWRLGISIDPYNILVAQGGKSLELDMKISASGSMMSDLDGKVMSGSAMIDMNLKIIENDLYITLNNYTMNLPRSLTDDGILKNLPTMKGITYHMAFGDLGEGQTYSEIILESQKNQAKNRKMIEKMLSIFDTASILTPIGKSKSDGYILSWNPMAIIALQDFEFFPLGTKISRSKNEILPFPLYYQNWVLSMNSLSSDGTTKLHIQKNPLSTNPELSLDFQERGVVNPLHVSITGSSDVWKISAFDDEYKGHLAITADSVIGYIDQWIKRVLDLSLQKLTSGRWTYDISAAFEDISMYVEEMKIKISGTFRQEFGNFAIVRPVKYQELSKVIDTFSGDSY